MGLRLVADGKNEFCSKLNIEFQMADRGDFHIFSFTIDKDFFRRNRCSRKMRWKIHGSILRQKINRARSKSSRLLFEGKTSFKTTAASSVFTEILCRA